MKTSCEKCVLAEYSGRGFQVDCRLDRLRTFRANGVAIDRVEHDGGSHYVVDAPCHACRQREWAPDVPDGEMPAAIRRELAARVAYIMVAQAGTTGAAVTRSLDSIVAQVPAPSRVIVVVAPEGMPGDEACDILRGVLPGGIPYVGVAAIPWGDEERGVYGGDEFGRLVDIGVGHARPEDGFYCVLAAGQVLGATVAAELDGALNDLLKGVSFANLGGDAYIAHASMFRALNGNRFRRITAKVDEVIEQARARGNLEEADRCVSP